MENLQADSAGEGGFRSAAADSGASEAVRADGRAAGAVLVRSGGAEVAAVAGKEHGAAGADLVRLGRTEVAAVAEKEHGAADMKMGLRRESKSGWGDALVSSLVNAVENYFSGGVVAVTSRFLRSGWFLWPLAALVLIFLFLSSLSSPIIHIALWNAAGSGDIEVVRECLSLGVDLEEETEGSTALWIAARNGHVDVVDLLIRSGADLLFSTADGKTAVLAASEGGHVPVLRRLLEESQISASDENYDGWTPLLWASACGRVEVVKFLVDLGVRGGIEKRRSTTGESALNVASLEGHLHVASVLATAGANLESASTFGRTPLISACIGGNDDVAQWLLEQSANCAATDRFGRQAIYYACANRMTATVRALQRVGPKCGTSAEPQVAVEAICDAAMHPAM